MLRSLFVDVVPVIILIVFSSFINALLHELGHAIPLLFFTKGQISIYIGSFGDKSKSVKISAGRLVAYITYNPILWIRGICVPPKEPLSLSQRIFFVSTGALTSVLLTIACWYILKYSNHSGQMNLFIGACLFWGLTFSLSSLLPIETSKTTTDGKRRRNDLSWIIHLFKIRKYYNELVDSDKCLTLKKYQEANDIIDSLIARGYKTNDIYRRSIGINSLLKNHNKAQEILDELFKNATPIPEDYINAGYVKSLKNDHDSALKLYEKALSLNPNHVYALNNFGYTLSCIHNNHNHALPYLNKAIELNPNFGHPFNNRGYARLKNGDFENAFADISHSLELDDSNAYAYRNLGIYFFDLGDFDAARMQFEKARQIDEEIPMLGEYLERVNKQPASSD